MPGDSLRLCRHMHSCGPKLCLRYTLSDGEYIGEIDIAVKGDAHVWQMLAYDLLAVATAAVEQRSAGQPGEDEAPRAT